MGRREIYRRLGRTGLDCHPLGFGCYRVALGNDEHEAALRAYLALGGNLIDTSANYGDGLSEALVGHVLRDVPRGDVVLVTKGGYIQGQNLELARARKFPETVHYGEGIWHSIHPEFLETQVERSLDRLQVERVDVYLLHNPEYFLTEKEHHAGPGPADHVEFYRRIREAFRFLEGQVARGRIGWYGISSNNFGLRATDRVMTSVARCLEEARSLRADHHFAVVQLPCNLYEGGGALETNNDGRSVLELSRAEHLGVLANRPLNAFAERRLVRLADFVRPGEPAPGPEALRAIVEPLRAQEARLALELGVPLARGRDRGVAELLEEIVPEMQSPAHWEQAIGPTVLRPVRAWLEQTAARMGDDMRWASWRLDFLQAVQTAFEEIGRLLGAKDQAHSDEVRRRLVAAGYPDRGDSLSRMALNVLLRLPGLDCVLVGMRRLAYVEDAMGAVGLPPVDALGILAGFEG